MNTVIVSEESKQKIKAIIHPAEIVVDVDRNGVEYRYAWREGLGWLNLTTEKYVPHDTVMRHFALNVIKVYFGENWMTGNDWRDADCPRVLRIPVARMRQYGFEQKAGAK